MYLFCIAQVKVAFICLKSQFVCHGTCGRKSLFQGQIGEYKKLLDMRAARIHKLEMQLRESTYGQVAKNVNVSNLMSHTVHTPSGQSLFEIHILQANLTKVSLHGI